MKRTAAILGLFVLLVLPRAARADAGMIATTTAGTIGAKAMTDLVLMTPLGGAAPTSEPRIPSTARRSAPASSWDSNREPPTAPVGRGGCWL